VSIPLDPMLPSVGPPHQALSFVSGRNYALRPFKGPWSWAFHLTALALNSTDLPMDGDRNALI
jgi:hypothetical protein